MPTLRESCLRQSVPRGRYLQGSRDGAVRQDYDKCIGCRMCMSACPYTGVRSFNWEEPKHAIGHAMGDADVATHQKHVVEKCTMCWHRLAKGLQPACVEVCPGRVRFFGDFNDPESEVSRLLRERAHKQLLPERGTNPPSTTSFKQKGRMKCLRIQAAPAAKAPAARFGGKGLNIGIVVAAVVTIAGLALWGVQLSGGLVQTGMRNLDSWGLYITMFMFLVGLSAGGLIISSVPRASA